MIIRLLLFQSQYYIIALTQKHTPHTNVTVIAMLIASQPPIQEQAHS